MKTPMRVMTEQPLNAETPAEYLTSWITPNAVFFDRNQGAIPPQAAINALGYGNNGVQEHAVQVTIV